MEAHRSGRWWRWGARLLAASAIYAGSYTALNLYLSLALAREMAWFRERGIPVRWEEIEEKYRSSPPPEKNALPFLEAAAALAKVAPLEDRELLWRIEWGAGGFRRLREDPRTFETIKEPATEADLRELRGACERGDLAVRMLMEASKRPLCKVEKIGIEPGIPVNERLLVRSATVAALAGDLEASADRWEAAVRLLVNARGWLSHHEWAYGTDRMLERTAGELVPLLEIAAWREEDLDRFLRALSSYRSATRIAPNAVLDLWRWTWTATGSFGFSFLDGKPGPAIIASEPLNPAGWFKASGPARIWLLSEMTAYLRALRACEEMIGKGGTATSEKERQARLHAEGRRLMDDVPWHAFVMRFFVMPSMLKCHKEIGGFYRMGGSDAVGGKLLLAKWAVQLRRHKLRAGAYPATLEALEPVLRAELPDPVEGKPLAYRVEGDGFVLYALGRNGTDDGGEGPEWWCDGGSASTKDDIVFRLTR